MFKVCVQQFVSSAAYISFPVDIATDMDREYDIIQ